MSTVIRILKIAVGLPVALLMFPFVLIGAVILSVLGSAGATHGDGLANENAKLGRMLKRLATGDY